MIKFINEYTGNELVKNVIGNRGKFVEFDLKNGKVGHIEFTDGGMGPRVEVYRDRDPDGWSWPDHVCGETLKNLHINTPSEIDQSAWTLKQYLRYWFPKWLIATEQKFERAVKDRKFWADAISYLNELEDEIP